MATSTLGSGTLVLAGTTSGTTTVTATAVAGTTTLTLPAATDTLVGKATTDTLTNKTLTSPTLTGVATFAAGSDAAPAITTTGDTNTGIFFPAADTIAFTEGGVESMRIDSSGNLGIGTTSNLLSAANRVTVSVNGTSSSALAFGVAGTRTAHIYSDTTELAIANGNGASGFITMQTNGSERMRLDSSGNLLVGGTSQSGTANRAAVFSANKFGLSIIDTTAQATGVGGALNLGGNYRSAGDAQAFARVAAVKENSTDTNYAYGMAFSTTPNGGTFVEAGRFDSSGNLVVGTTSAGGSKFRVNSAGLAGAFYVTAASTTATEAIQIVKYDNDSTTAQVFQKFYINDGAVACGQINANGANTAAFGSTSDSRLKENIVDLPSQLSNIMSLRPVEFDYIESMGGGHQMGFIAQEVQEIYPDLVSAREDGMLMLTDMNKNDARLIKAIQEMKAIIDTQASTITQLTARITALETA